MFSKSRSATETPAPKEQETKLPEMPGISEADFSLASAPKNKVPASHLSSDLTVLGNLRSAGDIHIEGVVEGDIRAHLLTVGENATVRGELVADDIVINGRVTGRVRGLKIRLTASARVDGDIIHKTIAMESGAQFEGSVQRQEDPLAQDRLAASSKGQAAAPASSKPASTASGKDPQPPKA